jgi:hypothetical protein
MWFVCACVWKDEGCDVHVCASNQCIRFICELTISQDEVEDRLVASIISQDGPKANQPK